VLRLKQRMRDRHVHEPVPQSDSRSRYVVQDVAQTAGGLRGLSGPLVLTRYCESRSGYGLDRDGGGKLKCCRAINGFGARPWAGGILKRGALPL
jgi:hypothetical protein